MLNLKLLNLLGFINLKIFLFVVCAPVYAQDAKMDRLVLQYKLMLSSSEIERSGLQLSIADKYINEGDYTKAFNINEKVKENASNKNLKHLISAKAEFLIDNYNESLSFLNKINRDSLTKENLRELNLYKLLNYSHLMYLDSIYLDMTQLYSKMSIDTTGIWGEIKSLAPAKFLDLKKAKRRSSIFPGAGLAYVGEKRHAFGSAFLCLAFLGYTAYSVYTRYYITGALTGLSQFQRFYNGGKRAAIKIGNKKNRIEYINYVVKMNGYIEKKLLVL